MDINLNQELSEYIKLLRFKAKKSQDEMANSLNISRNTYSIWENNPIKLNLDKLIEIGELLNENILIFFNKYVAKCNMQSFQERKE